MPPRSEWAIYVSTYTASWRFTAHKLQFNLNANLNTAILFSSYFVSFERKKRTNICPFVSTKFAVNGCIICWLWQNKMSTKHESENCKDKKTESNWQTKHLIMLIRVILSARNVCHWWWNLMSRRWNMKGNRKFISIPACQIWQN